MAFNQQWLASVLLCILTGLCIMIGAVGVSTIDQHSTALQSRDLWNVNKNNIVQSAESTVTRSVIKYSRCQLLNFAVQKNAVLPYVLLTSLRRLQLLRRRRGCRGGAQWQHSRTTPCNISVICGQGTTCLRALHDERTAVLVRPVISRQLPALPPSTTLLSCYIINARSLQKNNAVQLLSSELNAIDGDVAAVTETWLSSKVRNDYINIPGYNFFRQERQRRKGGGVGVFVRESLRAEVISTPSHDVGIQKGHELICVKILKSTVTYILVTVYHPPKPIYNPQECSLPG